MKNKRNKKLLASILLSMSLISSISNKAANANYKDEDRGQLNGLVENIYEFTNSKENAKKDVSKVSESLFSTIKNIYDNRQHNDPNSVLYKSMQTNMHIENKDLNLDIGKYKQYGPDALKAMAFMAEKFKGGHFTVWNGKTKAAINKLAKEVTEQINHCDSWFWALGGTQEDIDEYKNYLKESYYNELKQSENQEDVTQISKDVDREMEGSAVLDNIKRVLNVHSFKNKNKKSDSINSKTGEVIGRQAFYSQGFQHLCYAIFSKFNSSEQISEDKEAKIYYVYDKLFDRLKLFDAAHYLDIYKPVNENNQEYQDFQNLCFKLRDNFTKNYPDSKLPDQFNDNECNKNFLSSAFVTAISLLNKNNRIRILDEIVFKNLSSDDAIQKLAYELYKSVVYYDLEYKNGYGKELEDDPSSYGRALFSYIQGKVAGVNDKLEDDQC